jgi:HD-like signal output (HDOD) protein
MHDLGILVLFDMIPKEYREFTQEVKDSEQSLDILEKEKFEITHSDIGYEFIRNNWKLEAMVAHSAEWHHRRVKDDKLPTNIRQAVSLANRIANSREDLSHGITSFQDRPLGSTTIQMLNLTQDEYDLFLEDVTARVQEAESLLTN